MTNQQELILGFLKALADESRLLMLRLLNEREYTVGELARSVHLGEPTVSHHLARLREAGLVTLRMSGNLRYYRVNETGLARFKRLVVEIEQTPPRVEPVLSDDRWIKALGWNKQDEDVLRDHTENGILTHLPSKQKKLMVILRWLATLFEADRLYSEAEVNLVLKEKFAEDYVGLRRDLVDAGFLRRERGGEKYWLAVMEADRQD